MSAQILSELYRADSRVGNVDGSAVVLAQEHTEDALLVGKRHARGVVDDREEDKGVDHAGGMVSTSAQSDTLALGNAAAFTPW